MKNRVFSFFFTLFLLSSLFCFCQGGEFSIGLKTGSFGSKIIYFTGDEVFLKSNRKFGIEVGFFSDLSLTKDLHVSAEINFLKKGGKLNNRYSANTVINEIELALPFSYHFFFGSFFLVNEIGFFYGQIINGYTDSSLTGRVDLDFKNNEDLNREDIGLLAGLRVGTKIGKNGLNLFLSWRYRHNVNLTTSNESGNSILTSKIRGWGVNIYITKEIK